MSKLKKGDKVKLKSDMMYEIIKAYDGEIYDIKALQPQFEWMPNFYPVYYSIMLQDYELLNTN